MSKKRKHQEEENDNFGSGFMLGVAITVVAIVLFNIVPDIVKTLSYDPNKVTTDRRLEWIEEDISKLKQNQRYLEYRVETKE